LEEEVMRFYARAVFTLLSVAVWLYPAFSATIIEYEVTDLPDTVPGQDRWAYRYFVSGFTFGANQGFTIWFDPSRYTQLETPSPPNAQWDVLVLQPDRALPDRGAFDALALANSASLTQPFGVNFVSLSGTPGSQPFDIDQFDAQRNFVRIVESGVTVPRQQAAPIPEPDSAWLIAGAAAFLALVKHALSSKVASQLPIGGKAEKAPLS
jgi:hypothetical protein